MASTAARWRCRLAPVRAGAGAGTGLPKKRRSGSPSRTSRRRPRTTANGGCAASRALDSWRLPLGRAYFCSRGAHSFCRYRRRVSPADGSRSRGDPGLQTKAPLDARNGPEDGPACCFSSRSMFFLYPVGVKGAVNFQARRRPARNQNCGAVRGKHDRSRSAHSDCGPRLLEGASIFPISTAPGPSGS